MSDKETRADAKLQNLPPEELEVLWRFRNPEKGGKKLTLEAIAVEVPLRYGFTVSLSTLSGFYKWLRLRRRIEDAAAVADQFKMELAKDPAITEEDLDGLAAKIFKTEMLTEKNASGYLAIANFQMRKERFQFEREKFTETTKGQIEKGLDALFEEIKGNKKAEALFAQLREVVSKA
jgi:hypothetical protein